MSVVPPEVRAALDELARNKVIRWQEKGSGVDAVFLEVTLEEKARLIATMSRAAVRVLYVLLDQAAADAGARN
jgi:hypothetical protein